MVPARPHELILAALSGVLLALAFPLPGYAWLAFVALVPLLMVMARRPFLSGYIAGVLFFAITLYWLNIVMVTYGRLHPLLSLVAYLLLVGYLAFFFAAATWVVCRLRERLGYPYLLTLPVVWIALELLRGILLTGFPWVLLGYSQHDNLVLIQSADLFGVYGISGLIVLANCAIAAGLEWRQSRQPLFRSGRYLLFVLLLLAANFAYGTFRLQAGQSVTSELEIALVQGNIDQAIKWSPANQLQTVESYLELTRQAAARGAKFVVWPESATPFYLQDPAILQQSVLDLCTANGIALLTGSPAYEAAPQSGYRYYNSAFLVSPAGKLTGRSDKVHLVPFGEYVPFGQFLPFIDKLVYGIGDFSAGEIKTLDLNGQKLGVLICYEAIFPELARSFVNAGSNLLVNITNDAWFGFSSAPHQHLAMARFRAVENRRWLVRSANTGISAIVEPSGRIIARSALFEKTLVSGSVSFLAGQTVYSRFGDLLPLIFLAMSAVWLWRSRLRK